MQASDRQTGLKELRSARRQARAAFWAVAIFSVFVNLLMLTGPLFMLQVYDRVLTSRSEQTLAALFLLVVFLFLVMGLLDFLRGRILARIGARFQSRLELRVFSASLRRAGAGRQPGSPGRAVAELEAVQSLLSSPVLAAAFDLPWTPLFMAAILIFHPLLGLLAIIGGGILILTALLNQIATRQLIAQANGAAQHAYDWSARIHEQAETVQSLGMRRAAFQRWQAARRSSLIRNIALSDRSGGFLVASRTWRLFLQSAMLAFGAYLVLADQLSAGAMVAASILLGRGLAPVETVIGQWAVVQRAIKGWNGLATLLSEVPPQAQPLPLPRPRAALWVHQLTVRPPQEKQAALRMVSFTVEPGQAVGVIGPSGAGKTTLARALTGVWPAAAGSIRLDRAAIGQYEPDELGRYIGYLPQRVQLFDGTIAQNIARLSDDPDPEMIVRAAKLAAAHELILTLPQGYDTEVSATASRLSGGQIQRIGLARALFGDPVLLILDEPNANLDNSGSDALNAAVRQMKKSGKSVLIMAHRPAAIQECDHLLMLENGTRRAFGRKEAVLRQLVQNHDQIAAGKTGGVA